jgi:hypothetical protein
VLCSDSRRPTVITVSNRGHFVEEDRSPVLARRLRRGGRFWCGSCLDRSPMATTRTKFSCELVAIRSKKSFAQVTREVEALFQRYDLPELARLTAAAELDARMIPLLERIAG